MVQLTDLLPERLAVTKRSGVPLKSNGTPPRTFDEAIAYKSNFIGPSLQPL